MFIAGNGLRAVGAIAALEDLLDIPILTANQILLWHAKELTGTTTPRPGYRVRPPGQRASPYIDNASTIVS